MNDLSTTEVRPLDPQQIRSVAAKAIVHDDTLRRYLRGDRVQSTSRTRIESALRKLGLGHVVASR